MRLSYKNIVSVTRFEASGTTYSWSVCLKDPSVSEGLRTYVNRENGVSVVRDYPVSALPCCVQKFVSTHPETLVYVWDEGTEKEVKKYKIAKHR